VDTLNPPVSLGLDVGQISDPTAIVVAEVQYLPRGRTKRERHSNTIYTNNGPRTLTQDVDVPLLEPEYTVRHLQRLPLGTGYLDVARKVAEILVADPLRGRPRRVFVDVTGVGRPVYEMVVEEVYNRPGTDDVAISPITFTHGDRYDQSQGRLGKAYMVSRLQALLQRLAIHAPDTPEVRAMLEELRTYEIRIDQDGKDTYGAFKVGKHDDLATALGLACLEDETQDLEPLDQETVNLLYNFRGY
jgi:hypothetical protein